MIDCNCKVSCATVAASAQLQMKVHNRNCHCTLAFFLFSSKNRWRTKLPLEGDKRGHLTTKASWKASFVGQLPVTVCCLKASLLSSLSTKFPEFFGSIKLFGLARVFLDNLLSFHTNCLGIYGYFAMQYCNKLTAKKNKATSGFRSLPRIIATLRLLCCKRGCNGDLQNSLYDWLLVLLLAGCVTHAWSHRSTWHFFLLVVIFAKIMSFDI